jgi:hypothetical protein
MKAILAAVALTALIIVPALAEDDLPTECTGQYVGAILAAAEIRCPGHKFHISAAGKRLEQKLLANGGLPWCTQPALHKLSNDIAHATRMGKVSNSDPVELWCATAGIFLIPAGNDLIVGDDEK